MTKLAKRLIIIAIVAVALGGGGAGLYFLNPFNMFIKPLHTSVQQIGDRHVEFSFSFARQLNHSTNQFAIWIEDMDGNYINTLYVTRWTAQGNYRRQEKTIPIWVARAEPDSLSAAEIDAMSGATPRTGQYFAYWDFTDSQGQPVTDSQYRYVIEGTLYRYDDVRYSGVIAVGSEEWGEYPAPSYSNEDSKHKSMLTNVKVTYYPE
jgi:hypothetical protein